jgi:hypothetical protein
MYFSCLFIDPSAYICTKNSSLIFFKFKITLRKFIELHFIVIVLYALFYLILYLYTLMLNMWVGRAQSVLRLATGWTVRGSNLGGGEIYRN